MTHRKPKPKTHGGARPGAGRPKTKGVVLQIKITPEQKEWLAKRAGAGTLTDFVVSVLAEKGMPS